MPEMNHPDEERFWSKVDKSGDCWEWAGGLDGKGYGQFYRNGRGTIASRVAYEIAFGHIPDGMLVCHKCDNRKCVRPSHLFLGTYRDNNLDAIRKGRAGRRPLALDKEAVAEICRAYERGVPTQQIARDYDVHRATVLQWVRRNGIQLRPRPSRRLRGDAGYEIARRYHNGESVADLAREFGMHENSVRYHLKKIGGSLTKKNATPPR